MRMLFFGSGSFAVPTLRNLQQNHDIAAVITQPDRPSGRGRKLTPTPVKERALELGLEVITAEQVNDESMVRRLLDFGADVGVVLAFGQKIGPEIRDAIPGGCINAHASLLPKYRGAAPFQWTILNGEEKAGVTVFKLVQRMDAGPILTTRWTSPKPQETADELHDRLAGIAVDAITGALELYATDPNPPGEPQDDAAATRAPKLRKEDGFIDFARPAGELAHFVCGMWDWPGARCRFSSRDSTRNEDVVLARARLADGQTEPISPGQLDSRLLVATGGGMLELLEIKPAGGKLMTWPEFANGRHVKAGDRFTQLTD